MSFIIKPKKDEGVIGFASNLFSGNIKYLYEFLEDHSDYSIFFVSPNDDEVKRLQTNGLNAYYVSDMKALPCFLRTNIWITSYGLRFIPYYGLIYGLLLEFIPRIKIKRSSKFIDLWHGIPFIYTNRSKMLNNYDYAIETSEYFVNYYIDDNPKLENKFMITGYPRNDLFFEDMRDLDVLYDYYDLPSNKKIILYAPSWGRGKKMSMFPWMSVTELCRKLHKICLNINSVFIIRMHPEWQRNNRLEYFELIKNVNKYSTLFNLSSNEYPDIQQLLVITDILVTDWSSIANDYILLGGKTIFLDIPFPGEKAVLSGNDRAGYIVSNAVQFFSKLQEINDQEPSNLLKLIKEKTKKMYKYVDGKASFRCMKMIEQILNSN